MCHGEPVAVRVRSARFIRVGASFCVWGATALVAQPYSAGLDDNDNVFDAPIPGFTGPGGAGKVSLPGYENPAGPTWVNPIFVGWADTVADYSPALGTHRDGHPVVDLDWQYSGETLGPVTGDYLAVASLGDLDATAIAAGEWNRPYSREAAAFPVRGLREFKFWSAVSRIDNVYGDRNLVCTCEGMEAYQS